MIAALPAETRPSGTASIALGLARDRGITVFIQLPISWRCLLRIGDQDLASPVSPTRTNKEVTSEQLTAFLAWLNPDSDRAGEEYERLRFRLHGFFSQRHCSFADELADETLDRVIRSLSAKRIENAAAYCYGVARNVYRESLRKTRDTHLNIDDLAIATQPPAEYNLLRECLEKCLATFCPESRNLILDYFSEAKLAKIDLHRRTSESLAVTRTALRMRVMRIKQRLANCVRERMRRESSCIAGKQDLTTPTRWRKGMSSFRGSGSDV